MKTLWILAAAATFAACHNRSDETGAAPNKGDSTAVKSGYDTTQAAPTPAPAAAPADTGMKKDTTSQVVPSPAPADTTNPVAPPQNPTYDTTSTSVPTTPPANPAPGATTDTTMPHDSSAAPR